MRRLKLRVVGLAIFGVFVSGAAFATSASANFTLSSDKCEGGTTIAFCWTTSIELFNLRELIGSEEFEALLEEGTKVVFKSTLGGEKIEIGCTGLHAEGDVLQPIPLGNEAKDYALETKAITFSSCKLEGTIGKKCLTLETQSTNELVGTPLTAEDLDFTPKSGTTFIELKFSNNGIETCPATINGKHVVTGEQLAEFENPGADEEEKTLKTEAKSGLLFAENTAEFEATVLVRFKNLGTDFFDVVENA